MECSFICSEISTDVNVQGPARLPGTKAFFSPPSSPKKLRSAPGPHPSHSRQALLLDALGIFAAAGHRRLSQDPAVLVNVSATRSHHEPFQAPTSKLTGCLPAGSPPGHTAPTVKQRSTNLLYCSNQSSSLSSASIVVSIMSLIACSVFNSRIITSKMRCSSPLYNRLKLDPLNLIVISLKLGNSDSFSMMGFGAPTGLTSTRKASTTTWRIRSFPGRSKKELRP